VYDSYTKDAVMLFQQAMALEQSGEASCELQLLVRSPAVPTRRELESIPEKGFYKELLPGSNGVLVARLQRRLIELGYARMDISADVDELTLRVVNRFRSKVGMERNDRVSPEVQALLYSDYAPTYQGEIPLKATLSPATYVAGAGVCLFEELRRGSRGQDVLALEKRLKDLNYFTGTPDDYYDVETADAVALFQKNLGVRETGRSSSNMLYQLYSDAAPPKDVALWGEEQDFAELYVGTNSDAVLSMQKKLWELGYLDQEDIENSYGLFNGATIRAVQQAQLAMGYAGVRDTAGAELPSFLLSDYSSRIRKN
jgi:peptidoglycan hydrolase-like protein with peptidoglycan-binding domain